MRIHHLLDIMVLSDNLKPGHFLDVESICRTEPGTYMANINGIAWFGLSLFWAETIVPEVTKA